MVSDFAAASAWSLKKRRSMISVWLMRNMQTSSRTLAKRYNRFAEKRRRYLREYRDGIYTGMLLTGKLDEHLKEIGDTAQEMFDQLVEQMKKAEGVTERLKTENQMEWVGRMNSICSRAEEVVLSELVYC